MSRPGDAGRPDGAHQGQAAPVALRVAKAKLETARAAAASVVATGGEVVEGRAAKELVGAMGTARASEPRAAAPKAQACTAMAVVGDSARVAMASEVEIGVAGAKPAMAAALAGSEGAGKGEAARGLEPQAEPARRAAGARPEVGWAIAQGSRRARSSYRGPAHTQTGWSSCTARHSRALPSTPGRGERSPLGPASCLAHCRTRQP